MSEQPPPVIEVLAEAPERRVYPAASFAGAQPFSALDMVRRLPGFVLDEADADVRGFGGSGNILIDGDWPTGKQQSTSDLLKSIPAASVDRIEVIRGQAAGVDMRGKAMLANVVRHGSTRTTGSIEAEGTAYRATGPGGALRLQAERQTGERRLELLATVEQSAEDDKGKGTRRLTGPDGRTLRAAAYDEDERASEARLRGAADMPLLGGGLRVAGAVQRTRTATNIVEEAPGDLTLQRERERSDGFEATGNWDGKLAGADIAVGSLFRRTKGLEDERSQDADETEAVLSKSLATEAVMNVTAQRDVTAKLRLKASLEGAYNALTGNVAITSNGVPVVLPGSNVKVTEDRGEAMAGAVWRPTEALTLEGAVRVEHSVLRQTGEYEIRRPLTYVKPRLTATWQAARVGRLFVRIEREVGQLDFGDFTSSVALDQDSVSAGAGDLRPDRRWVGEVTWERPVMGNGALTLTARRELIDDAVDRLALVSADDELFDARGNIGDARRDVAEIGLTLPLDRLGVPGGLLKGEVRRVWSRVDDPTTGERRRLSNDGPLDGSLNFTQDLPARRLRWGFDAYPKVREDEFRFDEVRSERQGLRINAFVERSFSARWRLRLDVLNLTNRATTRSREIYGGVRAAGRAPVASDTRPLRVGAFVRATVRRTF